MINYYDVYNWQGLWVGCYCYEWQAEQAANENNGYYLERNEVIMLEE